MKFCELTKETQNITRLQYSFFCNSPLLMLTVDDFKVPSFVRSSKWLKVIDSFAKCWLDVLRQMGSCCKCSSCLRWLWLVRFRSSFLFVCCEFWGWCEIGFACLVLEGVCPDPFAFEKLTWCPMINHYLQMTIITYESPYIVDCLDRIYIFKYYGYYLEFLSDPQLLQALCCGRQRQRL